MEEGKSPVQQEGVPTTMPRREPVASDSLAPEVSKEGATAPAAPAEATPSGASEALPNAALEREQVVKDEAAIAKEREDLKNLHQTPSEPVPLEKELEDVLGEKGPDENADAPGDAQPGGSFLDTVKGWFS